MSFIQPVILAAGQGKRMHSAKPKVLHTLGGVALLEHVLKTAAELTSLNSIIVVGHQSDQIKTHFAHADVDWVEQSQQLGTGHALQQVLPKIADNQQVLVLYGDVPLVSVQTLKRMIEKTPPDSIAILTSIVANPAGYGRIKRNAQQHVTGIVEEKDASAVEKKITEVNTGIYLVPARHLKTWLPKLENKNAQKEYYLTDIITFAVKEAVTIHTFHPEHVQETQGINDRIQLAEAERFYQAQQANKLMLQGVTLADPTRIDIRGEVTVGKDVFIDVNVILEGRVVIGDGCEIGANTIIRHSHLGNRVQVRSHSILDGAEVAAECVVGPFARLRPGAVLASNAHVGNFVEIKNSYIGEGSKANHLSYVGDSEVGSKVNIGAGTITCNYDGVNKHKTVIGHGAFIGSGTQLVAPVSIGNNATIGAGSTITQDAPAEQLTLARMQQQTIAHWKRPEKLKE